MKTTPSSMKTCDLISRIFRPTSRVRLAVVGVPSSGKSYLLSDMVYALGEMGFEEEPLPLSYPHSSLGAFFYDASCRGGGMKQTPSVTCRTENHYGARLIHCGTGRRLELDFLNIPGETFKDANLQLNRYDELADALRSTRKGLIELTTWENPSGQLRLVVEPALDMRKRFRIDDDYPTISKSTAQADVPDRALGYMQWEAIYGELNAAGFQCTKREQVDGKYLLSHFFQFQTDSFFATLSFVWNGFASHLDHRAYFYEHGFQDFYFIHYCTFATDVVVCDRMYVPAPRCDGDEGSNYQNMMQLLTDLLQKQKGERQVYLALRGADAMMRPCGETYRKRFGSMEAAKRRSASYGAFVTQIRKLLRGEQVDPDLLVVHPDAYDVASGGSIESHLQTRLGSDVGHAFRRLLFCASGGQKSPLHVQEVLPPHVYFTATPIDDGFCFYDNDATDATRFVACSDKRDAQGRAWRAFHLMIAQGRAHHLCFGTYQMLEDIIRHKL